MHVLMYGSIASIDAIYLLDKSMHVLMHGSIALIDTIDICID